MSNPKKYIYLLIFCLSLTIQLTVLGQTPGLIIKPAQGAGAAVLDPDGDGYVSQKTNGIQMGFTVPPDNDVFQSEIPYVALVRPDMQGDLERGPTGGFTEIVGTDAAGNNAILTYSDDNYLYYRFRLSGYAPNSKSYSILIDTDQKFGFTGPNADPNAVPGNPGFEAEIVLETNFNIYAFNVDGSAERPETAASSALYDTNCQKSMAVSSAGGDPDYFYDFFLPYPATLFTRTTPLRYVAITSMNPMPAIGNNAVSDVGGVEDVGNLDQAFEELVSEQTPTVPGEEVLERTDCPLINTVAVANTTITGTTVASGATINVSVYLSDGTTLIGSGTTTTAGSNWSINVTDLSPAVTLTAGYKVKATATATGKGVSYDNCDIETVTDCSSKTPVTGVTIADLGAGKGFSLTPTSWPIGTVVTWYNSNYTLGSHLTKKTTGTLIPNPVTTNSLNQIVKFECGTGNCFPNDVYYFTFQRPGECVSDYISTCLYASTGTSGTPTITSNPISTGTTSINGTCSAIASPGTIISLYVNGNFLKSVSVINSTNWTINGIDLTPYPCGDITVTETDAGMCPTSSLTGVTISRQALKPVISFSGCSVTTPITSISGTSSEADGTIITLYTPNSSGTSLGTTTVSGGVWTKTGLNLTSGTTIVAKVTSGTCLTESPESTPVTISTQTNISSYSLTFAPAIEKQTSVSGSISGGSYPVTLKLYVDETYVGSGIVINSAGNWNVSGLNAFDLAVGGKVQVTLTGTGCESELSSAYTTVQCITPIVPAYTGGSKSYCFGGTGVVALSSSEVGVIYQLVNASGTAQGPAASGTGNGINLYTNILTSALTGIYVKAYKIGNNACAVISGTAIQFDTENPSPTVTFTSTGLSVAKGTTSVNLPYSAKSNSPSADKYTIDYSLAANNQGFVDVTTQTVIPASPISLIVPANPATGTYSGTITIYNTSGSACTTSYGFTITVYQAGSAPVISAQPVNNTICSGQTSGLSVTASGTVTGYQWQSCSSYGGTYTNIPGATSASYTTPALATSTYYRVVVSNANGSVTSSVATITVTAAVAAAGAISGTNAVCAGQNGVSYSVGAIANATSYTWSYSGTGAFIIGTGSSIFINFGENATSGTLSVAGTNTCGSGTTAVYVITVNQLPTVVAGTNIATCLNAGAVNITAGASASDYGSVTWTSSGTGTFTNANSLTNATYAPSVADITAGSVTLTLTATGTAGCGNATSTKTVTIHAVPTPSEITAH